MDDEIGGDNPDLDPLNYDISVQQSLDAESEHEVQNHLPTWARQTLSSAGDNNANPDDPRRTRSYFQRASSVLSCPNYLMSESYSLMIISDPKSYYNTMHYSDIVLCYYCDTQSAYQNTHIVHYFYLCHRFALVRHL